MLLKSLTISLICLFAASSCAASELHPAMDLETCITEAQIEASQSPDTYELDAEEARTFCESYID